MGLIMTDFSKILDKAKELEAKMKESQQKIKEISCLLYTSPSPRDMRRSRMPSSA